MTAEQRRKAIKMHNEGFSYAQIAEYFKVNKSTIKEIIKKYEARYVWRKED